MEIRPRVQPDVTVKFGSVLVGLMGKNRLGKQNKALLLMRSPGSQVNQSSPDSLHSSTQNLGCFPLFYFFMFHCAGKAWRQVRAPCSEISIICLLDLVDRQ